VNDYLESLPAALALVSTPAQFFRVSLPRFSYADLLSLFRILRLCLSSSLSAMR